MKFLNKIIACPIFYPICFFASGFIGGFFGGGGGIIIVKVLGSVLKQEREKIFATTSFLTFCLSSVTCIVYSDTSPNDIVFSPLFYILPAIGGFVGAMIYSRLKFRWLNYLFAVLTIISGIIIIAR